MYVDIFDLHAFYAWLSITMFVTSLCNILLEYGRFTIHAPSMSIPREACFPTSRSVDKYFQDGRRCKWVSQDESQPIEEIFDWLIGCSSLKYENDILQLHKRKPCSKVVIWGVKIMATLTMNVWRMIDSSPRTQRAKSTHIWTKWGCMDCEMAVLLLHQLIKIRYCIFWSQIPL